MTATDDSTVVTAFRQALGHQLVVVFGLLLVLALAWNIIRTVQYRRSREAGTLDTPVADADAEPYPEPAARRLLRISFGVLWVFDGLLQTQGSMPLDLPGGVLTPAASSSPGWVQHLVNVGATIWSNHPVTVASAAVWIEIGVGAFLLVAPRGHWSRTAGAIGAGWGLVVWMFGEAFGGLFGQGSSWLFGFPGAAVLYVLAGVLVALPESRWESPRLGRALLRGLGVFFVGMGILEAWPGRGFWSGQAHGSAPAGTLVTVARDMAKVAQPPGFSWGVRWFGNVDAAHGWAVNAAVVVLLVGVGALLVLGRTRLLRAGVIAGAVLCLSAWILVQDFGFLGGVGTNPDSLVPMVLVLTAGYLATVRLPVRTEVRVPVTEQSAAPAAARAGRFGKLDPSSLARTLGALAAVGVVLVGAVPMALAAVNPSADPIVSEVTDGTPNFVDAPEIPFTLTDQSGHSLSLASLRGHTVILGFLDPVCTTDCPLMAQELRLTDQLLGARAADVDVVAVATNPLYDSTRQLLAFDEQEGLDHLPNWYYLTGSPDQLNQVWDSYGVQVAVEPAGAMIAHSDIVYVIDSTGHTRVVFDADPGPGTASTTSSFSDLLATQVQNLIHS